MSLTAMSDAFDDPPAAASLDDLVDEAIAEFQPYYDEPISRERGRNMVRNLADVFLMLSAWKREDEAEAAAASPAPAPACLPPEPVTPPPTRRRKPRKFPAETP
ncbi:MAG: hypothetical protein Q8P18_28140 [Pseudomonadota bacterium]|nr:hypothetical protein [Pseudomonadota bacterium]